MTSRSLSTTTAQKKVVTKKKVSAKKLPPLVVVGDSMAFWTIDGQRLVSLEDLMISLKTMERRVYNYHADASYQDFAKWVQVALKDSVCAAALKKAKTAKAAEVIIKKRLKAYGI